MTHSAKSFRRRVRQASAIRQLRGQSFGRAYRGIGFCQGLEHPFDLTYTGAFL